MTGPAETAPQTPWHALPTDEVLHRLDAHPDGLTSAEALRRLAEGGPNELRTMAEPGVARLVFKQLRSPLIYLLFFAAMISAVTGHPVDAGVILIVVAVNALIGVVQERRAERALDALRQLTAPRALVLRDGVTVAVAARDVASGDVLVLEAGDRVAADARLLESIELRVDESALTGESNPVVKMPGLHPARRALADRVNMVWMSTHVVSGRGRAVVTGTGMRTVLGEIAGEVRAVPRADTPLQQRMRQLAGLLGTAALVLSAVIFLLGLLRGYDVYTMLLFAVATAVSAIPEGLPTVISVVLALGALRMAARHAVLRRLPAVETLGSTTVICTDKTGTITRNEMTVTRLWVDGAVLTVSGEGYAPEGEIRPVEAMPPAAYPDLDALLILGCLVNNAVLEVTTRGWEVQGDPLEGALLVAARKAGLSPETLQYDNRRLDEIPFSSATQYMATLHHPAGLPQTVLYVKGAPERILASSRFVLEQGRRVLLTDERRRQLLAVQEAFAAQGLRVLAGAYRELPYDQREAEHAEAEQKLTFVGLWGMLDPPRQDAIHAIHTAQQAGIRVVMITGDHLLTAISIARQAGILHPDEDSISGEELDELSDIELRLRVRRLAVFARVSPSHKLRVVNALRDNGEIVAMTGDGVNDAPALKSADIGIAMGVTGTEVAKEAADMVLLDDNFGTIVNAVEEGRVIFGNLRKVVFFLITTNLGEIITLTVALLIGLPLPVTAVMILWVNLVTDGLCTAPLGMEPGLADVLQRPPRRPHAGIIDPPMLRRMLVLAPLMAAGTLGLFAYALRVTDFVHAQSIAFTTLVAFQWFHALNTRSQNMSIFRLPLLSNPWLFGGILLAVLLQVLVVEWGPARLIFRTDPLTLVEWILIILVSSSILIVDELFKAFRVYGTREAVAPERSRAM